MTELLITHLEEIGRSMIRIAKEGYRKTVLEGRDIIATGKKGR